MESSNIDVENKQFLDKAYGKKNIPHSEEYGCILGALMGDAIGTTHEFSTVVIPPDQMEECMTMPGKGPFNLGGGQVTDDGELTLCLLQGINKGYDQKTHEIDFDQVAYYYGQWVESPPFDIGKATEAALGELKSQPKASIAYKNASEHNSESQSNGSLMRCTPLAVFGQNITNGDELYELIAKDINMTHPGMIVHASIYLYQRCIGYLLRHRKKKNRAREAFELAKSDLNHPQFEEHKSTLNEWLQLSEDMSKSQDKSDKCVISEHMDARNRKGHIKHAVVLSFYFLLRYQAYVDAKDKEKLQNIYYQSQYETIAEGGDTDTNACIVGGMVGALVGIKGLPRNLVEKMLQFDCTLEENEHTRPEFLSVRQKAIKEIDILVKNVSNAKKHYSPDGYKRQKLCSVF